MARRVETILRCMVRRAHGIMGGLEGLQISTATSKALRETSFKRPPPERSTRPAQRLPIAAAVTEPAIFPELSFGTEASWGVDISTEAAGPNRTNTRHSAKQ